MIFISFAGSAANDRLSYIVGGKQMAIPEEILRPKKNISGGASLPHNKNTAESKSVIMPPPEQVVIPMQQHIGAPCQPCVKKGDTVFVGTKIGDSDKFISAPIHSGVSGTVSGIGTMLLSSGASCQTVIIDSDGLMTPDPDIAPVTVETPEQLVKAARDSGLVGLGGAGFPAHVKLKVDPDNPPDTLIINGAECEPYITSDYRECVENTESILGGVYLLKKILGFKQVIIAVENNKPKAIKALQRLTEKVLGHGMGVDVTDDEKVQALYKIVTDEQDADNSVHLMRLKSRYPQGAEKVLIYTATGRKLPLGKLPSDVGCLVMNITSVSFLYKYITTGMPLVSKMITVDGNAVREPKNVVVPIGTPSEKVIEFCGGCKTAVRKVLYGGPMMGVAQVDASMPITKQNNAILVFDRKQAEKRVEQPCIRCGRCAKACPMKLQPLEVEPALRTGNIERVKALYADYCIECGCCSYVCPSKRHMTQVMRMAKAELRQKK